MSIESWKEPCFWLLRTKRYILSSCEGVIVQLHVPYTSVRPYAQVDRLLFKLIWALCCTTERSQEVNSRLEILFSQIGVPVATDSDLIIPYLLFRFVNKVPPHDSTNLYSCPLNWSPKTPWSFSNGGIWLGTTEISCETDNTKWTTRHLFFG